MRPLRGSSSTGRVLFVTVPIEHFTSRGVGPGAFPYFGL
jgi:hypothetical protein